MGIRNELVTQRESIKGAWAAVDVALQRRADLIPNLVETVKGFAKQEKGIMEAVANARAGLMSAALAAGKDRRQQPTERRSRPPAAGGGELSESEVRPELPAAAG